MNQVSIFGYGVTMKQMVKYLNKQGIECNIFDDQFLEHLHDETENENNNIFLPTDMFDAKNSSLEIISPGIPPHHPLVQKARHLIGEYDYFYDLFDETYAPQTIWISGTNGKTTTTEMLTFLLSAYGACSGGNIGTTLAELYMQKAKLWILETSSFTMHYLKKASPKLYLLLPVKEDHILWHGGFEAYLSDKLKPLKLMKKDSFAIIPKIFEHRSEVLSFNGKAFFYQDSDDLATAIGIQKQEIVFKEPFLLDALLALYATKILYNYVDIDLLNIFKVGKHRLEEFRDKKGNLWVDDSKGTNVDATLEALKRYKDKKIFLILGGDDKGMDQNPIFNLAKNFDVKIFVIGRNAKHLLDLAYKYRIEAFECEQLEVAVGKIKGFLDSYGVGLLSPAAASLDQFNSYKERGELFKKYVLKED
ncbi:UDP-N-acetylmuramoyl-L-alanine--D-glutamate ligase [Helicobacter sp. 13S00477-4]|uniref:UDP-N-acetylmuramoyl-L-alanine--D-glutamate ligase n=1 Tax=Helicobacter sp. 13S00477-4 TaxID=1905759 RepID=UPI000BA78337|nr:UDP-N-acetylmuramoyl-L-alanine--D-glutamate ligase [Helicobacter sp. 13S00477-4]PAF51625.1 UDP-N-acetylmuramoyl-L-alanine--D-glutamate ligase [Helicobacter sp. 13S00477-4]